MKTKFKTNALFYYANKYSQTITEEEELEKIDMTEEFYRELEMQIKEGELITITINAKVRLGKSTAGLALAKHIHNILKENKLRPKNEKFGLKNIARDQQEYSKIMRNPQTQYTIILIDEENELENTGENITAEKAYLADISNIQAGRYVHTIRCCPKGITDPNSDIILEIIGTNKKELKTHALLYYRLYKGAEERMQLLGHVNINVAPIITNWHKTIKKHFYKPEKTKEDEEKIQTARKNDWYVEYTIKKYEKLNLMNKEGISRPRMLDYAELMIEIIEELRELAKIGNILKPQIVKNFVKGKVIEKKLITSMLGEKMITDEIIGVLETLKGHQQITRAIKRLEEQQSKPEKMMKQEEYARKTQELLKARGTITKVFESQMRQLEKCKEVNRKYKVEA